MVRTCSTGRGPVDTINTPELLCAQRLISHPRNEQGLYAKRTSQAAQGTRPTLMIPICDQAHTRIASVGSERGNKYHDQAGKNNQIVETATFYAGIEDVARTTCNPWSRSSAAQCSIRALHAREANKLMLPHEYVVMRKGSLSPTKKGMCTSAPDNYVL